MTLNITRNIRSSIAKFRTSTHNLAIETGRYTRPIIPSNNCFCKICNSGQIEDEQHLLLDCNAYKETREILFSKLTMPNSQLLGNDKMIKMMKTEDEQEIKEIGIFITKAFCIRRELSCTKQMMPPLVT